MKILNRRLVSIVAASTLFAIFVASTILLLSSSIQNNNNFYSPRGLVEAKKAKKRPTTTSKTGAAPPAAEEEESEPLLGAPAHKLTSIEEFRKVVMETTIPVLMFLGSHKKAKQALCDNVTAAAIALEQHVASYYFDIGSPVGKEFLGSIGIPQTDETSRIFLWNPEFIKQQGGYGKQPAQYTGGTSPYGITRWFMAMISRKNTDIIEDVEDLVAFKNKYKQYSLPKVLLVTGSNFTSPMFVTVGHQYRFLAHFGVIRSVTRKAYDMAMDIFEKEERELRKVKDLNLGGEADSTAADGEKAAAAAKRHLSHNFALHDDVAASGSDGEEKEQEKQNSLHAELLHVLGVQSVPAIVTASADLGDVEVHPVGHNNTMTLEKLQEIVASHALSDDQRQKLFGQILEYEFGLDAEEQKLAREQKKNKKKNGGSDDSSSSDSSNNDLSKYQPVWVKKPEDWKNNCPHKKSGTLCVAVFSEDIQGNILKYDAKVEELAKGIKKIEARNRNGYSNVKLMLFENNEQNLKLAKVWSAADGVFPAVVFVNPNKGTYYNHMGSFTGSSMADFVLGRMKTLRAKTFNKEQVLNEFFDGDDEEKLKKKKAKEAAEKKKKQQEEEKRKKRERMSPEQREKVELEESISAEDL